MTLVSTKDNYLVYLFNGTVLLMLLQFQEEVSSFLSGLTINEDELDRVTIAGLYNYFIDLCISWC
jgi:hypothetical protein